MRATTVALGIMFVSCLAPAGPAAADELSDAMQRADCLNFLNTLGLSNEQLTRMVAPLKRIQQIVKERSTDRQAKLARLAGYSAQVRASLMAGREVPASVRDTLRQAEAEIAAADLAAKQAVHGQMELIAGLLTPLQNQQLDWTPPPAVRVAESTEDRIRRLRQLEGLVTDAGQLLQTVRNLDPLLYVTRRVTLIGEYLAQYLDPNSPAFQQAHQTLIEYTGEVRMLEEPQWQQQARAYAERMVQRLGLMPGEAPANPNAVSWGKLYSLFTDPQTLKTVEQVLAART